MRTHYDVVLHTHTQFNNKYAHDHTAAHTLVVVPRGACVTTILHALQQNLTDEAAPLARRFAVPPTRRVRPGEEIDESPRNGPTLAVEKK